jgi:hypothetical protein
MAKRIKNVKDLRAPSRIKAKPMKVRGKSNAKVGISGRTMAELGERKKQITGKQMTMAEKEYLSNDPRRGDEED